MPVKKIKKSIVKKKAPLKVVKKAAKIRPVQVVEERLQELRDVVEALPELPMPGAPIEIPKDLPDLNPVREPTIIPAQSFYARAPKANFRRNVKPSMETEREEKRAQAKVWLAVAVTFLVIAGGWAATLKGAFYLPKDRPKIGEDFRALRDEWEDATENIKNVLQQMNSRLGAGEVKNSPESEEVLKAIGARVIFEAGRATSTE